MPGYVYLPLKCHQKNPVESGHVENHPDQIQETNKERSARILAKLNYYRDNSARFLSEAPILGNVGLFTGINRLCVLEVDSMCKEFGIESDDTKRKALAFFSDVDKTKKVCLHKTADSGYHIIMRTKNYAFHSGGFMEKLFTLEKHLVDQHGEPILESKGKRAGEPCVNQYAINLICRVGYIVAPPSVVNYDPLSVINTGTYHAVKSAPKDFPLPCPANFLGSNQSASLAAQPGISMCMRVTVKEICLGMWGRISIDI